jgi:hypothetical protein
MHSDGKKRRSFLALLFAAGDLRRYVTKRPRTNVLGVSPSYAAIALEIPQITDAGGFDAYRGRRRGIRFGEAVDVPRSPQVVAWSP